MQCLGPSCTDGSALEKLRSGVVGCQAALALFLTSSDFRVNEVTSQG